MKTSTTQIVITGTALIGIAAYLYSRRAQAGTKTIAATAPAAQYSAPLVLRSSGNTTQGVAPLLAVAANPKPFQVTDAFSPNILF